MLTLTTWVVVLLPLATALRNLFSLVRNIRIANNTGVPYIVVPVFAYNRLNSILFARTVLRLCDVSSGPASDTSWRVLTSSAWGYRRKYRPFQQLGTDTFLTVAPGGIILYTADADVIAQVNARGNDFPKATHLYKHVDIYGKNVVSSEGAVWRKHRAITSAAFTEKNNKLVWKETLEITQSKLASSWGASDDGSKTIRTVAGDAMKLSLEVIGRAGLGKRIDWPTSTKDVEESEALASGHALTFTQALQFVLTHIFYIIAVPMWFLQRSPFKKLQQCYQAYVEWGSYLQEMITAKRSTTQVMSEGGLDRPAEVDLISQLLKAQKLSESAKSDEEQGVSFDDSDVIGNLFMFIIAGHETSANSIHFAIVLLAMHPHIQKQVQEDLSTILDNRPVSEWTYERDLKALSNSLLAAVLNEQLRLIGPVIAIPKITNHLPQTLTVNGKVCILPAHTNVRLCASSVHFNPKVWPRSDPSTISMDTSTFSDQPADDLMEFKPSRWRSSHSSSSSDTEQIYNPPKGAFIAFSEGQRACLGKRFAQIEILAALAVILSQYSVELAVDNWASDEEVAKMSTEEQARVWKKAEDNARSLLRDKVSSILTLQLRGAHIPVRFVKKGEERSR